MLLGNLGFDGIPVIVFRHAWWHDQLNPEGFVTDASTDGEMIKQLRESGIRMIPGIEHCEVTAAYAGLRPATEFQDYQIRKVESKNYICVGGIRSTVQTLAW